jgi:uncharacterized Rmd1/YagE family protein
MVTIKAYITRPALFTKKAFGLLKLHHLEQKSFRVFTSKNGNTNRKYSIGNRITKKDIIAPLQTNLKKMGPPQRKRNPKAERETKITGRVSVYCTGSAIDLVALRAHVFRRSKNIDTDKAQPLDDGMDSMVDDDVLHVCNSPVYITADAFREGNSFQEENATDETEERLFMAAQDIFYFEYGCVVFWGLTSREERAALTELSAYTSNPLEPEEIENSFDTMEYILDKEAQRDKFDKKPLQFDLMRLRSQRMEEKLALSYAMAQSSKLFFFEQSVNQCLERTRYLPRELSSKGKISMSKTGLNKLIGELFVEQMEINLFSSILDTPNFLWDDEEYIPLYQYARAYLEIGERVDLLNNRLTVIRELLDVLTAQVADIYSNRLEWIVIWLIAFEIVLGIASNPLVSIS